jgi:hypothetical protein
MLWSPQQARRLQLKESLLEKPADGPQVTRSLTRRFHNLPMALFNELLLGLEQDGEVILVDNGWTLPEPRASLKRGPVVEV